MVGAHELIMALPQGYNTSVGARVALSAGQRQRIALARAFFGDPKLIVLDEPDANLDMDGGRALAQALAGAKAARITLLIVTHRRALLPYIDKLLVLKEGRMALFGPTQEVIAALNPVRPESAKPIGERAYAA
jgi:ABC-type protease/lipase transport system fused ATPase/permease subunit